MAFWSLIGQAYGLPLVNFSSLVIIFWRPAAAWAVACVLCEYLTSLPTQSFAVDVGVFSTLIACYLLQSFTMASGLVRWHWFVVYDWPPIEARLWLQREEWQFWRRWFWLGLAASLLALATCLPFLVLIELLASDTAEPQNDTSNLAMVSSMVFGMALTAWLFPRNFLSLAAIAVREGSNYHQTTRQRIDRSDCFRISLAALLTTIPAIIVSQSIYMLVAPQPMDDGRVEHSLVSIIGTGVSYSIDLLAVIVFATMLSLFYRQFAAHTDQAVSAP